MKLLSKAKEKSRRNKARLLNCRLHSFDCAGAAEREKRKQEKWGVAIPLPPIAIKCRCKNCGGVISLMYAAPYMEALKHVRTVHEGLAAERDAAVRDLEKIMFVGGRNINTCDFCATKTCYARGGCRLCDPEWRGMGQK